MEELCIAATTTRDFHCVLILVAIVDKRLQTQLCFGAVLYHHATKQLLSLKNPWFILSTVP